MSRIKWSTKRSADDNFDFLLGHVGGKLLFTANPQRFGAEGAEALYDLHSFIAGTYEEAVVRNQLEARAEQILDQAIRLLTGAAPNRGSMNAEEIARQLIVDGASRAVKRISGIKTHAEQAWIIVEEITAVLAAKDAEPKIQGSETPLTREPTNQETGDALLESGNEELARELAERLQLLYGYQVGLNDLIPALLDVLETWNLPPRRPHRYTLEELHAMTESELRAVRSQSPDEPRPSGISVEAKPNPDPNKENKYDSTSNN